MTVEAAVRFLEATSADESLRTSLAEIIGVGDGDLSTAQTLDQDEAHALLGERGVLVASFADRQGYKFTVAELGAVVDVFQRYQAGELSDAEFSSALGIQASAPQMLAVGKSVGMVYRGIRYDSAPSRVPQVIQFVQKTAEDEQLREELKAILEVGDGDISSFAELDADEEQALKTGRGALVAEFAARHGFTFTMSDLFAVIDAFHRVKTGEMTEEVFAKYVRLRGQASDFLPFIQDVVELTYKGVNYPAAIPSSSKDNALQVVRFIEKSKDDRVVRAQLQSLIGGDGNISSPAELDAKEAQSLVGDRSAQIVDLGAEHGFRFTVSDLSAVVGAFQLVEAGKLPLENCMRILGLKRAGDEADGSVADVTKTAGLIYRGVRY
jgi:hypothetical protein